MGNLNALVDYVLHPDIPYLDEEHFIVGGITVFVSAILFCIVLIYVHYLNNAQASNEKLRHKIELQLNSAGEGILGLDINGNHTFINPSAAEMLGYKVEELIGKPSHATWHHSKPDGSPYPEEECNICAAYKNGSVRRITNEVFWRKDGTSFPVEYTSAPIYEDGRLTGVVVTFNNITEQKKAETALRESEEHFRAITELSIDAIITSDTQNNIIFCNPAAERMYGYSKEELIGQPAALLLPERLRERNKTSFQKALAKELPQITNKHIEACGLKKNQQEFPIEVSVTTYKIDDKVYFAAAVHDMTDSKLVEAALIENEEKYRTLVEHANDGIIIIQDAIIRYANQRMAELDGSSVEQLVGTSFIDHVHPDEVPKLMENYRRRMAGESLPSIYETVLQRRDGSPTATELNIGVILYQGKPAELVIIRDITERKQMEMKLRTASLYARSLIEASIDPLVTISPEGKITDVNKATEQVTGIAREQLVGSDFSNYFTEPEKARQGYQTVLSQGLVKDYPLTIRHSSGRTTDVLYNATPYRNEAGEVQGVFAAARDITERRLTEDKLIEAKEQLEKFIEHSIDPIIVADSKGYVVKPNKAFLDMIGYAEEEIIGKMVHSLSITETGTYESTTGELVTITEDFFKEASACIEQLIEKGKISNWQAYYMHKSRKIIPIVQHITLIDNKLGERRGSFSIIRDLTEQKKAEAALRESEEHFRAITESSIDAIITSDTQNNIIFCNPAAERMYGYSKEELIGQPAALLVPERLRERNKTSFQKAVKKEMPRLAGGPIEVCGLKKDQQEFPAEVSVTTYKIDDKKYFTATVHDITERKKLEEQIRQSQKMEAIGTLAGGVAHDLNNILSAMISYPELLLLNLPEDSPMRKPIVSIKSAGEKAAAIVNDLLTLARRGVNVSEVANLNAVITDYIDTPQYEKLKSFHPTVDFEINLASDLLNTMGSPVHFSKTVMNLISNAAESMPEGGKVVIATENQYLDKPLKGYSNIKEGEYNVFTVKDNGIGISQEDLSRIFEPFYTKKVMGRSGTGLGLAVVWGTVQDHNGYIEVESAIGNGTAFKLYFPATRKEIGVKKESLPIENYSGNGEHILVVDDMESQREIASSILTKLNYQVEAVASGEEAVEYVKSRPVDLVVLDMIMNPGIDGLETYRRILEIRPKQKAIIASGFSETEQVKEAQRLGAGTYIKKPYIMGEIGMAIKIELAK